MERGHFVTSHPRALVPTSLSAAAVRHGCNCEGRLWKSIIVHAGDVPLCIIKSGSFPSRSRREPGE